MYSSEERNKSLMGTTAMKSVLGGATANIQRYGCISLSGVGVVGDICTTHSFIGLQSQSQPQTVCSLLGNFTSLINHYKRKSLTDAPATRKRNNDDLERQAKARQIKEELIKEKGLECALVLPDVFFHSVLDE